MPLEVALIDGSCHLLADVDDPQETLDRLTRGAPVKETYDGWLATEDGSWVKRSAIIRITLLSEAGAVSGSVAVSSDWV